MEEFWEIVPTDFKKYLEAYRKRKEAEIIEKDYNNWILGKYLAFSYHDPKKYPKKPFLTKEEEEVEQKNDKEMERIARRNTIILGGKIKWQ